MELNEFIERIKTTNNNLVMLVGVPLSGKSTFVESIKDYVEVISRDSIILEMGVNLSYDDAYDVVDHKNVDKTLKEQMFAGGETTNNYVIDLTSLTLKARNKSMVKFRNHTKIAIVFEIPSEEELLRRNKKRSLVGKTMTEEVMNRMIGSYVCPTMEEDFDYIIHI